MHEPCNNNYSCSTIHSFPSSIPGTCRLFNRNATRYGLLVSPAAGALAASCLTVVEKLARTTELGQTLMAPPAVVAGVPRVEAARSKSASVPWLTTSDIGAIVGLAAADSPDEHVRDVLRMRRIETNRVRGIETGVSLAKHAKLVQMIADAMHRRGETRALPLVARVVWEKAQTKNDILDYTLSAAEHFSPLLGDHRLAADADAQDEFLAATQSPADITPERAAAAAQNVLSENECAESLETIATSMATRRGGRIQVRLERHAFEGAPDVPDCVEVVAREFIENVLWDSRKGTLDAARLPPGADERLREWTTQFPRGGGGFEASARWFPLCQRHPSVTYLSRTPADETGGNDYEVSPTRKDLAHVVSRLLFGIDVDTLTDVAAMWNDHAHATHCPKLEVEERVDVFRSIAGDEHRLRFIARARLVDEPGVLHLELQEHPPTASAVSTPCTNDLARFSWRHPNPTTEMSPLAWWVASAFDDVRACAH